MLFDFNLFKKADLRPKNMPFYYIVKLSYIIHDFGSMNYTPILTQPGLNIFKTAFYTLRLIIIWHRYCF
uniref:Uncharacterized protein n=1 Tax=uncultured Desulfobacterium sp. TaxID=201089 RepID=E1YHM5_9BACT|nr:unknown protein [uncultured Desulfobacterium sp.]